MYIYAYCLQKPFQKKKKKINQNANYPFLHKKLMLEIN